VSYDVLNAVAMKYVIHFRCRHFFLDEFIVPKENLSPFIKIHFTEDVKPKQIKDVKKTFAKLRDYTKENPNAKKSTAPLTLGSLFPLFNLKPETTQEKTEEQEMKQNTFLYLGKTNNFRILQDFPKPKRVLAKFTSPLLEGLNTTIKREVLSYRSYCQLKEKVHLPPSPEEPVAESNEI
jgi:hypothetical protein